jgi:hypothetical protein
MLGWVFLFGLAAFQTLQNVFVFRSVGTAMQNSAISQLTTGAAALVVGAGVPLGFLIYQLYYEAFDNWMPLSLAPQDRGGDILRCLPDQVKEKLKAYDSKLNFEEKCEPSKIMFLSLIFTSNLRRLKPEFRNHAGKDFYRETRQNNFEIIRFYLSIISMESHTDSFKNEYTNLSDIYNSIGAARMGLVLSFILYFLYNILSPIHRHALASVYWYPLLISILVFVLAFTIMQSRRTRTGIACQAMLANTAKWYAAREENDQTPAVV